MDGISVTKQIEKLASKKSMENLKSSEVKALTQNVQPKSSLSSTHEIEKQVPKAGKNKYHIINTLKSNPSLTKELRTVLEQTLAEKLESLGIKSGVHGIPSDHLNRVLISVESAREERKKQVPDIQHIREQLERQVSFRVAERTSCSRFLSSPYLSPAKQGATRLGTSLSTVVPKPVKRSSVARRSFLHRTLPAESTSTPKTKKNMVKDEISGKAPDITTPPFSSEEEVEETDIMQSYISPELSRHKATKSGSKDSLARFANQSDVNVADDEVSQSSLIQQENKEMEKFLLSQRKESKQLGGLNDGSASIKTCAQGVKFTDEDEDEDEDDWDLSSLEDEKPLKENKIKNVAAVAKNDSDAIFTTRAWGDPMGKSEKDEGPQDADTTSTQKSSLVTVTDWSDSSDI